MAVSGVKNALDVLIRTVQPECKGRIRAGWMVESGHASSANGTSVVSARPVKPVNLRLPTPSCTASWWAAPAYAAPLAHTLLPTPLGPPSPNYSLLYKPFQTQLIYPTHISVRSGHKITTARSSCPLSCPIIARPLLTPRPPSITACPCTTHFSNAW